MPPSDCQFLVAPASQMPLMSEANPGSLAAVKQLQCLLKKSMLGISTLQVDGQWGPATQSAWTSFASCNNSGANSVPGHTPPYPSLAGGDSTVYRAWEDLYFWGNATYNGTMYYCNGTR
jgi:hypothetical protein